MLFCYRFAVRSAGVGRCRPSHDAHRAAATEERYSGEKGQATQRPPQLAARRCTKAMVPGDLTILHCEGSTSTNQAGRVRTMDFEI